MNILPKFQKVEKLDKYRENLAIVTDSDGNHYIRSYETLVAHLTSEGVIQFGKWSRTTQKHINYVSNQFDLPLTKYFTDIKLNK
jgi:hypothetical protein